MLVRGQIIETGGPELAEEIEEDGYGHLVDAVDVELTAPSGSNR